MARRKSTLLPAVRKKKSTKTAKKWSGEVTAHSDALTLENKVFKGSPKQVADSLKRSADRSGRRKSSPFRAAMSMLTFYINRAGKNLPAKDKKRLQKAKDALRADYGKS